MPSTKFEVLLSDEALSFLRALEARRRDRVLAHIEELEADPFRPRPRADIKNCGRHHGATFYRLRVGDFRVVYVVEERQVKVTEIFRRGRGYRWLE
ncbi:MAG: type II toxin-antitoxin system RelE/ParE family toxin [Methanobacteriota archaeon]|nr:MAG: type II toxin-antitoxin system RelE/ParE family toxin [Euryarchaeota archaeon]TLZ70281.1 MAG: type II toxin-antitoxin system RelE/ParE family toxin [Euryarchaeota archaeon]